VDLIYPSSPTIPRCSGPRPRAAQAGVDYALANQALILFDAAYEGLPNP